GQRQGGGLPLSLARAPAPCAREGLPLAHGEQRPLVAGGAGEQRGGERRQQPALQRRALLPLPVGNGGGGRGAGRVLLGGGPRRRGGELRLREPAPLPVP